MGLINWCRKVFPTVDVPEDYDALAEKPLEDRSLSRRIMSKDRISVALSKNLIAKLDQKCKETMLSRSNRQENQEIPLSPITHLIELLLLPLRYEPARNLKKKGVNLIGSIKIVRREVVRMVVTVYPIGTTIYKPEKCYNGYTIIDDRSSWQANLIDMNGKIVNEWKADAERTKLLADGNLLVCVDGARQERDGMGIVEFSWDHKIVWEYKPHGWPARRPHHDVERLSNGNTLVIVHDPIPEEYRDRIRNPVRRNIRTRFGEGRIIADTIYEVTPDKKIVWEWHIWEHLDINREGSYYDSYSAAADWTHANTVQALPENKWYDDGDERFKPGNILISLRNLSLILIVDKETGEIVWEYTGIYEGGLAGQHEPHMIERGIPGEGNIILFDNGAPDQHHHAGESFILEIEPPTGKIIWVYKSMLGGPRWQSKFYGAIESCVQRLPNGNALISEHGGPRVFEVTYDGEIVWEYTIPIHGSMGRCYRYPYDYCPQLEALGKPKEEPVIPPPYVKIEYLKNDTNLAKAYT